MDDNNLLKALIQSSAKGGRHSLVEVGASLASGKPASRFLAWSSGRIAASINADGAAIVRGLASEYTEVEPIPWEVIRAVERATAAWVKHRHDWCEFYRLPTMGYVAQVFVPPGAKSEPVQYWVQPRRSPPSGTRIEVREERRAAPTQPTLGEGVVLNEEIWSIGVPHTPSDGLISGWDLKLPDLYTLECRRREAQLQIGSNVKLILTPGEEAFIRELSLFWEGSSK